jgi:acetylornithine deacetylase
MRENRPTITYNGYQAARYSLTDHDNPEARQAISTLTKAHQPVTGEALKQSTITATTDARYPGLYWDIPALVYGPAADSIHGFNERVEIESMRRITQSIALFIAEWCGLEKP